MHKITKAIKEDFIEKTKTYDQLTYEEMPVNERYAFSEDWMYNWLFPEVLIIAVFYSNLPGSCEFPCTFLSEEEILRIMSESGITKD